MRNGLAAKPCKRLPAKSKKISGIQARLADERGKEVVLVSHCLLNMNTRYWGGAFRQGCVKEIAAPLLDGTAGIVQMKCPEQHAWGGVQKRILWIAFDAEGTVMRLFKPLLLWAFISYTRLVYRRIANETVRMIADYERSEIKVRGIIGVDGSPSCGATVRLDMEKCFDYFMKQHVRDLNRSDFNEGLYAQCAETGPGIYIHALMKALEKKKRTVPLYSHNLMSEMKGQKNELSLWERG